MHLKDQFGKYLSLIILLFFFGCSSTSEVRREEVKQESYSWINTDTIKAGRFDTGTMWTFEYPPLDYFKETYNFSPDDEWLNNARMAALRFATYCSASFVSADGLVMTNNHCARESITEVQKEDENLQEQGFIAETLENERRVPGLFVEQLALVKDVTEEIHRAADKITGYDEKEAAIQEKIAEIEDRVADSTGLDISITALYYGARYSLYGYKRYNDVRLVFTPEAQLGYFGGDIDNFTYPRYNLDCTFFRVYDEEGNPLRTKNYYKWSSNGPSEEEAVFVVGNPGSTTRLHTVAQLEFARDIQYPRHINDLQDIADIYLILLSDDSANKDELENLLLSYTNSIKAYNGMLQGLRDPVLMAKKRDFENKFYNAVQSDQKLAQQYGNLWNNISEGLNETRTFANELYALNLNPMTSSEYFFIASDIINIAGQLKLPEDQRAEELQGEQLDSTIVSLMPDDFDHEFYRMTLEKQIGRLYELLGEDYPLLNKITGGRRGRQAVNYMMNNSFLSSQEELLKQVRKGPDAILNSDDPFIYFILNSGERRHKLLVKSSDINIRQEFYTRQLGRALFDVYGTSIAPDATFTLRISDGIVKGFPYNGTIAPSVTTFYGMYDRYYSFNKEYPFNLPDRWINPPEEFDMSAPFNFVSTNDISGGSSGSAVINRNGEIVGLAFDGNIQSLPGSFIFTSEENRTVSVHSVGMLEAIRDLYNAQRLADELLNGMHSITGTEKNKVN